MTTPAEAARLALGSFPPDWAIRHAVDRALRSGSPERTAAFEVNDLMAAAELIRHGLGVSIMPPSVAVWFQEPPTRPFPAHAPVWTLRLVHTRAEQPPAITALLRHIG
ncbi:LysR substrate-binding domain-containing protein [Streptomyces sp. NPDC001508]|uniref:LysR substrate-binding domain-containing protein n=1 Tax=Streptomyces sp. NPDC001508 TaxID=3154656 RepID=UPI0033187F5F